MRHYKDVTIPERIEKRLDKTTCDICNELICEPDTFEISEIVVSRREGESFPEGGSDETEFFDICERCWKTRLVPYLEGLGAKKQVKERDW